jgi:hypothetical protein
MKLPRVTDHAVLRYLERVRRVDIAGIRRHIAELCAPAAQAGSIALHAEGHKFEMDRRGTVVTVAPHSGMPSASKRRLVEGA